MTESESPFRSTSLSSVSRGIRDGTHGTFVRTAEGRPLLSAKNVRDGFVEISDHESLIAPEDFATIVANGFPRSGDVLLTIVGSIGRAAVYDRSEPAAFQRSVGFIRPSSALNANFACYQFTGKHFQDQLSLRTKVSAQPGIYLGDIGSCKVFVPDLVTQLAVVEFLDRETAEIDAFIADQEELIALLTERRAATISHAVTQGLDPTVPMKDSGVEWLGTVPANWEAGNIRRFAQMKTGHTPSRSHEEYWLDCSIPWFTLADVWQLRQGGTYLGETKGLISEVGLANSAAELLPAGTVVLSRTASVGFSGIMPRPMATSQDFWNWVCGERLLPKYLWYQFLAMRPHFGFLVQGSTHKTIYQADAAALAISVPSIEDQLAIVDYLDHETAELDAAISDAREAITLSKERRAALISAAVTGKIDVRGLA